MTTTAPTALPHPVWHRLALVSLLGLIALCLAWELVLAPLRPEGSWLALKALPLTIPMAGLLKKRLYTLQWTSMFILLYQAEGAVRLWSDTVPLSRALAGAELILATAYFIACLQHLRAFKRPKKAHS